MTAGRPTNYKDEYCQKVDEYLVENIDKEVDVIKYESKKSTGYEKKLTVQLPTIGGFSLFIGVPESTLYDWRAKYPEFSESLEKIVKEQEKRLLNKGLSGDYNSTIAKLILSSNHGMRERSDLTSDDKPISTEIKVIIEDMSDESKDK